MWEESFYYLERGTKLHKRYVTNGILEEEGFEITYYAQDEYLAADVAVREYFPQGTAHRNNLFSNEVTITDCQNERIFSSGKDRAIREAVFQAKYHNQAVFPRILDYFEENNTVYIVTEYLDHATVLDKVLKEKGRLSVEKTIEIMSPVIKALDALHKSGFIHRNVNPDNILIRGNGDHRLILEYGTLKKYRGRGKTKKFSGMCAVGYTPLEQFNPYGNREGPWSDIYALCATMYKCLTGKTPETAPDRMRAGNELRKPSELGIPVSPEMEQALLKGMSLQIKERYRNLEDFCEDFYGNRG